jgi:hypothetical protein
MLEKIIKYFFYAIIGFGALFMMMLLIGYSVNFYEDIVSTRTKKDVAKCIDSAEKGDTEALYNLGERYASGQGVPRDCNEAVRCYTKAAEQGNVKAQNKLGSMYFHGSFVPRDNSEAIKWWTKAAEQGNAEAQFLLGVRYAYGEGVPKNYNEAVKWYTKAADQKNYEAQCNLGEMYLTGEGVPQDYMKGVLWFESVAVYKKPDTKHRLQRICSEMGSKYYRGESIPQDYKEAAKWFARAAEHGGSADFVIRMYLEGKIRALDDYEYEVVTDCFIKAAEQGNADAQYILGQASAEGKRLFLSIL